jgi:hypothetical protein
MATSLRGVTPILLLAILVGAGCQSITPMPGAPGVAAWQKAFRKLDCHNPRHGYDMPSTDPLRVAMTTACFDMPRRRKPRAGWMTLVAIDAARDQVRAVPISSMASGGLRHGPNGDITWYSSIHGLELQNKRFLEKFALRKEEQREVSLGRIQLPFVAGHAVGALHGDQCSLVTATNELPHDDTPRLAEQFLVAHDGPFDQARRLPRPITPLFWNPAGRYFVVQEGWQERPVPDQAPPRRFGLDCSGQERAFDPPLQARLAQVGEPGARFLLSARGDLLASAGNRKQDIRLFRGETLEILEPPTYDALCTHEMPCGVYLGFNPVAWSPTGEHFMVDVGFAGVRVYRTSDLAIVAQWSMKHANEFPQHGFLSDHAAYEFNDHSRMVIRQW